VLKTKEPSSWRRADGGKVRIASNDGASRCQNHCRACSAR
jgi:hypothetical protein